MAIPGNYRKLTADDIGSEIGYESGAALAPLIYIDTTKMPTIISSGEILNTSQSDMGVEGIFHIIADADNDIIYLDSDRTTVLYNGGVWEIDNAELLLSDDVGFGWTDGLNFTIDGINQSGVISNFGDIFYFKDPTLSGYTIKFDVSGGYAIEELTEMFALPNPLPVAVRPNAEFLGWYMDKARQIRAVAGTEITQTTWLYAKYNLTDYNTGIAGLPSGAHTVTVRARGEGFSVSPASNEVIYNV